MHPHLVNKGRLVKQTFVCTFFVKFTLTYAHALRHILYSRYILQTLYNLYSPPLAFSKTKASSFV